MAAYKRKIFLIKPRFQLRFSIFICILLAVSSAIYPLTIYDLMTSFMNYAAQDSPELASSLSERRTSLIVILSLWQLGFTALAFIFCIYLTHKVAGPLYKMQKFFRALASGQDYGKLSFRGGDYFQDLAEDYNQALGQLKEDYKNDIVYLSEVNAYLDNLSMVVPDDKKAVINEISKRLTEIQNRFNEN